MNRDLYIMNIVVKIGKIGRSGRSCCLQRQRKLGICGGGSSSRHCFHHDMTRKLGDSWRSFQEFPKGSKLPALCWEKRMV